MAVKGTGQLSLAEALVQVKVGQNDPLDRLARLVDWAALVQPMAHLRKAGPGHPGWPVALLFKALVLQALYGLSERELETALMDRLSFKRFVGLGLGEAVPDHTVYCRFRAALLAEGLIDAAFAALDVQLEAAGLILKRGTMLDATLIEAVSAPPRKHRPSLDTDAAISRQGKRGGFTFGYKAHIGVDEGSGLIRSAITTPANVNDTVPADALIRGDERAVWADAAYDTKARRARLKAEGRKARIARRPNKHHPQLPPRLQRYNRLIARRRAAVETTFATLKCRMKLRVIRYVGLAKAHAQVMMAAIAFNMRRWAAIAA